MGLLAKISDTYSVKIVKTNLYVSVCLSRQFGNKETGVNTFSIVIASRKNALREPHCFCKRSIPKDNIDIKVPSVHNVKAHLCS